MSVNPSGDIAWVTISTALVMLMTPALGFFYGGLVRRKNIAYTIAQCFAIFAVVSLVWALWGYSLAFGPSNNGYIGNLDKVLLNNVGVTTVLPVQYNAPGITELLYFAFEMMFAAITPALIVGAFAERIKFRSLLIFIVLWSTFVYAPIAHWVWSPNGWLGIKGLGAIDFAGGTVVHVSAGLSAFAAAIVVGPRMNREKIESKPSNVPFVILGAALLWFGWFGFNAGSALQANALAVSAFVVTNLSAAAATVSWMAMDTLIKGKPSATGIAIGAVVGLVAITPASGYVTPTSAIIIGLIAGVLSNLVSTWRVRTRLDDTLDVFACHGVGGIWGSIATGLFATTAVNSTGANGLFYGNPNQLLVQSEAVLVVIAFAFVVTFVLLKIVNVFSKLRVTPEEEEKGLDLSECGEEAYNPSDTAS
ncbi:MAG: ammonium transporter [Candidatus Bathyarchaeia archaeon]